uniref:Dual serine/threonine and tyrosine protein kinase n=1 Tax=Macrostomum lignano TaxID=282301 RepID=A0A1I8HCU5_9PLAT
MAISQAEAQPSGFLDEEIAEFRSNRDLIKEHLDTTQRLLTESFSKALSPEFSAKLQESLKFEPVRQKVNQLYRGNQTGSSDSSKPCIIIVGQTKSGKSSFINELLGGTFVAQSQSPCTARVTRLTYSDRIYVLVRSKTGEQIGDVQYLEKPTIEEDLVKLKDEDRENDELISSTVEAGIKCEFLRHGIDIIDSPGLNENSSLDSLTLGAIDSFLPIIIYVIDSNSGITVAVQKDLTTIKKTVLGAEVFYLVTKMDVSKDTEQEANRPAQEIEEEKAERVFSKLQRLGYISPNETRDKCNKFLCVSCWEVRRFRRKKELMIKKNKLDPEALKEMENSKWVRRFEEVKTRILKFAQDQFRNLIVSSGGGLRRIQSEILTLFMDKATNIKESNLRKKKALYQIKSLEQEIHQQSKSIVEKNRDELLRQAGLFFAERKPLILDEVRALKYSESVISADMSQKDIEKKCVDEIHALINDRINCVILRLPQRWGSEIVPTGIRRLKAESRRVRKGCGTDARVPGVKEDASRRLLVVVKGLLIGSFECYNIQDKAFRETDGTISKENLVECLITSLKEWFEKQHREFLDNIASSEQLVESCMKLTEKERSEIKTLYPRVARLHMLTMDVISKYKYRGFRIDTEGNLGSGAQGEVFRVLNESGEPALAAKRIVSDEPSLDDIATEVYHSSVLEHDNLVHVVGVRLHKSKPDEKRWTVEIYMELMCCDAWNLMQRHRLPVRQRLKIGLELAKALQFLHSSELIHRDVKLANVLVSEDLRQVKLSDFGLVKSTGFVNRTLVGTPIYLAPELVRGESYHTSADVFSLGIALWYLFEGTGKRHPEYVEIMPSVGAILLAGALDCRPTRLPNMSDQLWDLMESCWSGTPDSRPTAKAAVESLQKIVDSLES